MDSAAFDYELPTHSIAQHPSEPRDSSRLLIDHEPPLHATTRDFPTLLRQGDVLVLNDTKVLPARLHLHKATGGAVEVLVLEPADAPDHEGLTPVDATQRWEALVKPSRRVPEGSVLIDEQGQEVLLVGAATGEGTRLVAPLGGAMGALLERVGTVPLPPYITSRLDDPGRYQTVYARDASSVAAPTAGLHLTPDVLDRCRGAGAEIHTVELSVGVGTFRPVETDTVEAHRMHRERYRVSPATWEACQRARRVVAVGTTVVRTLESVAVSGELEGRTGLFIMPGHDFAVVDALLTNFHMPRSTLLVMLEAFMGPRWRQLYRTAVDEGYRFLSFGDAMFVERRRRGQPGTGGT